jgi:tetratricopeptide (TPR) repeat protein
MNKYYAFIACLLGNNLMKEGKYGDAIGCYDQAVKLDWTNAVYLCNRYTNVVVILSQFYQFPPQAPQLFAHFFSLNAQFPGAGQKYSPPTHRFPRI